MPRRALSSLSSPRSGPLRKRSRHPIQAPKGVQFHKGNGEFTAKDVIFSWQDVAKEDSQHGESPYWRGIVKDIEAVNDYEVVFHLNRVDGNFFRAVGEAEYGMEIRSKAHADKMGAPTMETEPYAGTGPYQFKQRQQSQFILFEKVPYQHWRAMLTSPSSSSVFGRKRLLDLPRCRLAKSRWRCCPKISSRTR